MWLEQRSVEQGDRISKVLKKHLRNLKRVSVSTVDTDLCQKKERKGRDIEN